jgi:hypothetical protein
LESPTGERCVAVSRFTDENCVLSGRAVEQCVDRKRHERGRSPAASRPATASGSGVRAVEGESRRANRPSDSNPASVEISAAAEQQHHEEDDEQCGRVHFFLPCVWRARPCVIASLNAHDERRRFGALAVRITPAPTHRLTGVQAAVCSLLNSNKREISHQSSCGKIRRAIDR